MLADEHRLKKVLRQCHDRGGRRESFFVVPVEERELVVVETLSPAGKKVSESENTKFVAAYRGRRSGRKHGTK